MPVTIVDDDTATISIADVSVTEGTGGAPTPATFTISLATAADHDVTVHAESAPGTAGAGDVIPTAIDVTIPAGATSASMTVPVAADSIVEADETFIVTLSSPVGAPLGDAAATATIRDDDGFVLNGDLNVLVGEAAGVTQVAVTLNDPAPAGGLAFDYATVDGTATAPQDYLATSGVGTIAAGATSTTIDVVIVNDSVHEPGESFSVVLSDLRPAFAATSTTAFAASTRATPLATSAVGVSAVVTITDDDPAPGPAPSPGATPLPGPTPSPGAGPDTPTLPITGTDLATLLAAAALALAAGLALRRFRQRPAAR